MIRNKICQPPSATVVREGFFTTQPALRTGQGLSLNNNIISKSHRGEIKVETKEGEFAEFTIILPA